MTLLEIFVVLLVIAGLSFALRPLQRRLERYFFKLFRGKSKNSGVVIDITDYTKKGKPK